MKQVDEMGQCRFESKLVPLEPPTEHIVERHRTGKCINSDNQTCDCNRQSLIPVTDEQEYTHTTTQVAAANNDDRFIEVVVDRRRTLADSQLSPRSPIAKPSSSTPATSVGAAAEEPVATEQFEQTQNLQ